MKERPSYIKVGLTFARNSLIRDMTFRANFIIQSFTSLCWMLMNLGFYILVYHHTSDIGSWSQYQFYAFMATAMIINSLVQAFFMPNANAFSELIRTGNLDFALLKPIDTQFLISFTRVEWSALSNFFFGIGLMIYALIKIEAQPEWYWLLYPVMVFCGTMIFYSLMISLASTSIWLGRNQTLYNFWFYITNFSRYPMEIYSRSIYGDALRYFFTFLIPVLIVVNVPARLVAKTMSEEGYWELTGFAVIATLFSLVASRWIFLRALGSYRSASS